MEDLYSIHPGINPRSVQELPANVQLHKVDDPLSYSGDVAAASTLMGLQQQQQHSNIRKNSRVDARDLAPDPPFSSSSSDSDISDLMKAKIAGHPRYPALLSAFIDCRKVGAPPEVASLLEGIRRGERPTTARSEIGADPELDEFMESYWRALVQYREELERPFDEAASFLSSMETQLSDLCKAAAAGAAAAAAACNSPSEVEGGGSTDEDLSCGELDALESQDGGSSSPIGDQELKEMLLKKYSGYLSSLRKEFMKKRKKGKLPKSARLALLDWWNAHYRWPYPTEEEKARLAEITGLGQKQINNWFINQRKRHWKPSDDMRIALMEGVAGGGSGTAATWYFDTRTVGP